MQDDGEAGDRGVVMVMGPDGGRDFWQPVPANGHVSVRVAPDMVAMRHPIAVGTQTVAPGCYVRNHAHDRNEEVIHCLKGRGRAVIDGDDHVLEPGTTIFIGMNRWHSFINEGEGDLQFVWIMTPNGLETFFEEIGRPKRPGEPEPEPFPRPDNVLEIERKTVFAAK